MQKVKKILKILEREYPHAKITLDFKNPLELLIATILAAQCTDERVNLVTKDLFKKYRKAEDYVKVDMGELEEDIRKTGFYKNKAKAIKGCCRKIFEDFKGKVPKTLSELTSLSGVGRKTANIVLANAYKKDTISVDTHVKRVSKRLGLAQSEDSDRIEEELCKVIPKEKWSRTTHLLVFHGREICHAKKPKCEGCPLMEYCSYFKTISKS